MSDKFVQGNLDAAEKQRVGQEAWDIVSSVTEPEVRCEAANLSLFMCGALLFAFI